MPNGISEATLKRVRDYAVDEPGFTARFASWDLSRTGEPISDSSVKNAIDELVRLGIIKLIEDAGRAGKVYAYDPPKAGALRTVDSRPSNVSKLFPELDESRRVGELAPHRGEPVPHTRPVGPSGKPGEDKRRSANGIRVKRARQGT